MLFFIDGGHLLRTQKFFEKLTLLHPDTHTYVFQAGNKHHIPCCFKNDNEKRNQK